MPQHYGRRPLAIYLYAPQKEPDGQWHARARVTLPKGGTFEVDGRADERAAAALLAQMAAWRAARGMKQSAVVGGFFDDLGKGIATVTSSPVFKGVVKMATSAIPYVGPIIAATGVTDMAIDAANSAVLEATKPKEGAPVRAQIQQIKKRAKAGKPKARRAYDTLRAVHQLQRRRVPAKALRGLSRARRLLSRADAGERKAQRQISAMVERAQADDREAIQALGWLSAAQDMTRYYEPEEPDNGEVDQEFEDFVGQAVRTMSDVELVALLGRLATRKRGHRPEAQRTVEAKKLKRKAA
jgi:hypothetical protein